MFPIKEYYLIVLIINKIQKFSNLSPFLFRDILAHIFLLSHCHSVTYGAMSWEGLC